MRRAALLLVYLAIATTLVLAHEPWRDELQAWSLARGSASLAGLVDATRYEGHPSGWYLLLFALTRATASFRAVQLLHLGLIGGAVALLVWRAPLTGLQKALAVFGYFLVYEYAALARNYALGVLGLFLFAALARDWRRHWLGMALALLLMLQANAYAALLALAMAVPTGVVLWRRAAGESRLRRRLALAGLIVAVGALISVMDLRAPADSSFMPAWHWRDPAIGAVLRVFAHAFVPVPRPTLHFWNTSLLDTVGSPWLEWAVALAALTAVLAILRRRPVALAAFALACLALGGLMAVKYLGFLRHHGHFYLAFLGALWLGESLAPDAPPRGRTASALLTALLAVSGAAVMGAASDSIHQIYGAPPDGRNPLRRRLHLLMWLALLGPLVAISYSLSTAFSGFGVEMLEEFGLRSPVTRALTIALATALTFALDVAIVALLLNRMGGIAPGVRAVLPGSIAAALVITLLKALTAVIVSWSVDRPQYGSFAIPVTVLVVLWAQSMALYAGASVTAANAQAAEER